MNTQGGFSVRAVVWTVVLVLVLAGLGIFFAIASGDRTARVGIITADQDPYWQRVVAGAEEAADRFDAELRVARADGTTQTQTELLQEFQETGLDGIAISPVDPDRQGLALRQAAQAADLITIDSDAELTNRVCFVGMDNYAAGRKCGELIRRARPEGARIAVVMGPTDKANGVSRRQGVIDELLDRSYGPGRPMEALGEEHAGEKYTVATTPIDSIDPEEAQQNVAEAIQRDPEINCIVGLFAYSAPAALRAIEAAGGSDITVIGFDDDPALLDAIAGGRAYATVAQDQYQYGYHAVRLLAELAEGTANSIPITERVHFPPVVVTQETVERFRAGRR
jgi:ribose transport system substrate-binding protein